MKFEDSRILLTLFCVLLSLASCQFNHTKSVVIKENPSSVAISPFNDSRIAVGRFDGLLEVYNTDGELMHTGSGLLG